MALVGACASCGPTDFSVAETGFVASQLRDFLAVRALSTTDARSGVAKLTQVAGPGLRCRSCVLSDRDARDGAHGHRWRPGELHTVEFDSRPFGMSRSALTASYVVGKLGGTAAQLLGVRLGDRPTAVGGADVRGESADEVAGLLKAAALPCAVTFERAAEEWAACSACAAGVPERRLARGLCPACAGEADDEPAPHEPSCEEAAADSWEDLT